MKNIKAYIIDDEYHAVEVLADYIQKTRGLTLTGYGLEPLEALQAIQADPPDLLFLDIHLPRVSGLDIARRIGSHCQVVLTTSFREFGPEAFELRVADYLLKPISYERFLQCILQLQDSAQGALSGHAAGTDYFFVKSDIRGKLLRVKPDQVLFIESDLNYCTIHTTQEERLRAYISITELLEKLPPGFCQVHRSFMVNLRYIKSLEPAKIQLTDGSVLPLGPKFRAVFLSRLNLSVWAADR
jgi:two-component system LytT family response regulator